MVKTELSESYRQMTSQYIKNIDEKLTQYRYSLVVIADNTVFWNPGGQDRKSLLKGEQISSEVTKIPAAGPSKRDPQLYALL